MRILRWIVFCLLTMVAFAPRALADVSAEERQRAFAWFDTLGYPDVVHLPLVKFSTHYAREGSEVVPGIVQWMDPPVEDYGFLVQRDAKQFSVLLLSLKTQNLTFSLRTIKNKGIDYEPVGLQTYAEQLIKWQADSQSPDAVREHRGGVELFVLARACEGNGLTALAAQLCNLAEGYIYVTGLDGRPLSTLQAQLAEGIGHATFDGIKGEFSALSLPRVALLSHLKLYRKHFPNGTDHEKAVEMEKELQRMVAEDREHAAHPASSPEQTSLQSRIDELVFALRDQNGSWSTNPLYFNSGYCDVFADPRGEKSPAHQLRKIGLPAVPDLIEAVTDTHLTRSVRGFDTTGGSHTNRGILTVGDAAIQILVAIANRGFPVQAASEKEKVVAFQKAVRQWWAEVKARGETQVLVEGVKRGDQYSPDQARGLAKQDPKLALSVLREAIRTTDKVFVRQNLVGVVAEIPQPEALSLLKTQMRQGKELGTRVLAAELLQDRGHPEAVTCMAKEWKDHPERKVSGEDPFAFTTLLGFLIDCGSPKAMAALEERLQERDVDVRFSVVDTLFYEGRDVPDRSRKSAAASREWAQTQRARAAVEQRLLVGMLRDTAVEPGQVSMGGYSFQNPRLCDLANVTLANLWPQTYHYENSPSLFERDYACIATANLWRSAHGLAPLPLPARP